MNSKYNAILGMLAAGAFGGTDPGFGQAIPGQCYAANEASIHAAIRSGNEYVAANDGNLATSPMGLSQVLMNYVTGVEDPEGLDALLESIAPSVPVGSILFQYLQEDESGEFQQRTLAQLARPTGGEFRKVPIIVGTQANGNCDNIGLVSYIDINQGGLLPAMQQREVQRLRSLIRRSQIADAFTKISNAAFDIGSSNWGSATSDPDSDVEDMIDVSGNASGIDANTVVFGQGALRKRKRAYRQPARLNGASSAIATIGDLQDQYLVDRVVNSRARYRTDATTLARILDSEVFAYQSAPGLSQRDSSNVKRFTYVTEGGGIRVWVEVETHRVKITVDAFEAVYITRAAGIVKRAVTYT
jgi:hypothetical protein